MSRLILHAGTHKTGTTAIQQFAVKNRIALHERGLIYPDYRPTALDLKDGHHIFGHAFSDISDKKMTISQATSVIKSWKVISQREQLPTLISVEAVYRHVATATDWKEGRAAYLKRLADALQDFDVEVVLVFRRPDNFAKSLYIEQITTGTRFIETFQEWRAEPKRFVLNYSKSVSFFKEAFKNVKCLVYEDLSKDNKLITNFFSKIGVKTDDLESVGVIRPSLTPIEASIKNFANSLGINRRTGRDLVKWMKLPEFQKSISKHYEVGEYDVWSSTNEKRQFLHSRIPDLNELSKKYFSGEPLFDLGIQEKNIVPIPEIPEALKEKVTAKVAILQKK